MICRLTLRLLHYCCYWTEINLIGYKIELLEKQKVEYQKELKSRIIYIANKICK
uniref:Uncharacterized protein n=1 Tax=Meloidogyne enterolobii TaxID=390850 RepID=A0A6V7UQ71_MELEN|nr:unnamed protein product [Meloidogyne enterolobii]